MDTVTDAEGHAGNREPGECRHPRQAKGDAEPVQAGEPLGLPQEERHPDAGERRGRDQQPGRRARQAVTVDYPGAPSREDARYRRVDLIADVMDAAVPASHPLAGLPSVHLADMACDVWVGAAASDACSHIVTGLCAAAGFSPDVQHQCREWDAVAGLVAAGMGVALAPRSAQPLRPRDLAILPVAGAPATRLVFALTRAGAEQDPATRAVLESLVAVAAARPDGITPHWPA